MKRLKKGKLFRPIKPPETINIIDPPIRVEESIDSEPLTRDEIETLRADPDFKVMLDKFKITNPRIKGNLIYCLTNKIN